MRYSVARLCVNHLSVAERFIKVDRDSVLAIGINAALDPNTNANLGFGLLRFDLHDIGTAGT